MKLESGFLLGLVACAVAAPHSAREARIAASKAALPNHELPQWLNAGGKGMPAKDASTLVFEGLVKLDEVLKHQEKTSSQIASTAEDGLVENGIVEHAPCQPLTMIFARGTNEMGNMGKGIGRPLAAALRAQTGNKVIIQGVDYDASPEVCYLLSLSLSLSFIRSTGMPCQYP